MQTIRNSSARSYVLRALFKGSVPATRWKSTAAVEPIESCIKVTGLGSVYAQWPTLKPFLKSVPPKDITLDLSYTRFKSNASSSDSPNSANDPKPLRVVALHGAPGQAANFTSLAQELCRKTNVDFIAPTFPDLRFTLDNKLFWHSAEEKAALTETFLQNIGIDEVDVIVAHSAGVYAGILMSLSQKIKSKTLIIISSVGLRLAPVNEPVWLLRILIKLLWMKPFEKISLALFGWYMESQNRLGRMTPYDFMLSQVAQNASDYWPAHRGLKWARDLKEKRIPVAAILCLKDKLVPPSVNMQFAADLGNGDAQNHIVYQGKSSKDLKLINKPSANIVPEIIVFTDGGHFMFQQCPDVVAQHIIDFHRKNVLFTHNK